MQKYNKPEMDIAKFHVENILTSSGNPTINPDAPGEGGWGRSGDNQSSVDLSEV